jgi:hypothetical protein
MSNSAVLISASQARVLNRQNNDNNDNKYKTDISTAVKNLKEKFASHEIQEEIKQGDSETNSITIAADYSDYIPPTLEYPQARSEVGDLHFLIVKEWQDYLGYELNISFGGRATISWNDADEMD